MDIRKAGAGWVRASAWFGLVCLLAGCASLFGPREMRVPLAQLEQALQKKFPFNSRYLELFDVSLNNPKLALQSGTNRVLTTVDARIAPPFLKKPWQGKLELSGVLKIDNARNAVILTEPRLDNLVLDAATGEYTAKLAKLGALLAEDLLNNMPVYTFQPSDFQVGGARYLPSNISTRGNSVVVSFVPAK